jgi:hypothetical protein
VRSELGRIVQNMGDISVTARDGYVTLGGQCDPMEMDSIVNFVIGIRGVRSVDNQLRPRGVGVGGGTGTTSTAGTSFGAGGTGPVASDSATATAAQTGM